MFLVFRASSIDLDLQNVAKMNKLKIACKQGISVCEHSCMYINGGTWNEESLGDFPLFSLSGIGIHIITGGDKYKQMTMRRWTSSNLWVEKCIMSDYFNGCLWPIVSNSTVWITVFQVFSFVFGDGDPNQGLEEERWKLVILSPEFSGPLPFTFIFAHWLYFLTTFWELSQVLFL